MTTHQRKKAAEVMPLLLEWQRVYNDWQVQYEALQTLTRCGPEAPIALAMGRMWDAYTNAIAREVGDRNDWLDWYCWENDMGAKGQELTSTSGKTIKVTTVVHLARVICY